jgi:CoA:oxalate CoA-transferase
MKKLLEGVIILDLSRYQAGPYGTLILADLGAEVIKVEDPKRGDPARRVTAYTQNGFDPYFISLNRNKKSLTLDIKQEQGRKIFYELVKKTDVVYDNYRPEVPKSLKIDYETLKRFNPRIISCHVSGFGHNGPYRDFPAFDQIVQAMGGGMSLTGDPGGMPKLMGLAIGDAAGGMFAAHGVLAALYHRAMTGEGQEIDISMLDCQVSISAFAPQIYLASGEIPLPRGSADNIVGACLTVKTKDERYLFIAAVQDNQFEGLCKVMGHKDLANDPRFDSISNRRENRDEINRIIEDAFLQKTAEEWLALLRKESVPCGPINTVAQVVSDPHLHYRKMLVEVYHPAEGNFLVLGNPIKCSAMEDGMIGPPPSLGQHTEDILKGILGLSNEVLKDLKDRRII